MEENYFEVPEREWVWKVDDLPNNWQEEDLVEDSNWEVNSLNEGFEAVPYSNFIMAFKQETNTQFNPSKNFLLFHCFKNIEDKKVGKVVILVQEKKKYSIDIQEMEDRLRNNLDKKGKKI